MTDTTGPRDLSPAGLLTGILRGMPLRPSGHLDAATAASGVTGLGATAGLRVLPTRCGSSPRRGAEIQTACGARALAWAFRAACAAETRSLEGRGASAAVRPSEYEHPPSPDAQCGSSQNVRAAIDNHSELSRLLGFTGREGPFVRGVMRKVFVDGMPGIVRISSFPCDFLLGTVPVLSDRVRGVAQESAAAGCGC